MTPNLKTARLALFAVLALSAVGASGALAAQDKLEVHGASSAVVTAHAETSQVLTLGPTELPLQCSELAFKEATVLNGATSITVTPSFNKEENTCQTPLGNAKVTTNGCHLTFTADTDANGHAQAHINCPTKPFEVDAPLGCVLSIGTQTVTGISVTNLTTTAATSDDEITLQATVENDVHYSATTICTLVGIPETGEDGDYSGSVIVTGFEDVGGKEGARIGISIVPDP